MVIPPPRVSSASARWLSPPHRGGRVRARRRRTLIIVGRATSGLETARPRVRIRRRRLHAAGHAAHGRGRGHASAQQRRLAEIRRDVLAANRNRLSDKTKRHGYQAAYGPFLAPFIRKPIRLLEIADWYGERRVSEAVVQPLPKPAANVRDRLRRRRRQPGFHGVCA